MHTKEDLELEETQSVPVVDSYCFGWNISSESQETKLFSQVAVWYVFPHKTFVFFENFEKKIIKKCWS